MERKGCRRRAVLCTAVLALAAGCSARDVTAPDASGYSADASRRVASADWSRAQTVELELTEYHFAPDHLQFRQGQPYRLHLVNHGFEPHDFTSDTFFGAIAVEKLTSPNGDLNAPLLRTIGVAPGTARDLYFVAVQPGTYPFDCDEPLHRLFGMSGEARID